MQLIFVYNANRGIFSTIKDGLHKVVSPGTYPCMLCKITHGATRMKQEWKTFVYGFPYKVIFLHKDEFQQQYPTQKHIKLPALFIQDGSGLHIAISATDMNRISSVNELQQAVMQLLS